MKDSSRFLRLLPSRHNVLSPTELKEAFRIYMGLPSWHITRLYPRLVWQPIKTSEEQATVWTVCPYGSELRNAKCDGGATDGHQALQFAHRDILEDLGSHVLLEDKQTFPNRVARRLRAAGAGAHIRQRGAFRQLHMYAVDITTGLPQVTDDGTIIWAQQTMVYGDVTRIQADIQRRRWNTLYSPLPTGRMVNGKWRGKPLPVEHAQKSKLDQVVTQLRNADDYERDNGVTVPSPLHHMSTLRKGSLLALTWGAYNEPSSHQLLLLKLLARQAAQRVQEQRGAAGRDTNLERAWNNVFLARLTATAVRASANIIAHRLQCVDNLCAAPRQGARTPAGPACNGMSKSALAAFTHAACQYGYVRTRSSLRMGPFQARDGVAPWESLLAPAMDALGPAISHRQSASRLSGISLPALPAVVVEDSDDDGTDADDAWDDILDDMFGPVDAAGHDTVMHPQTGTAATASGAPAQAVAGTSDNSDAPEGLLLSLAPTGEREPAGERE